MGRSGCTRESWLPSPRLAEGPQSTIYPISIQFLSGGSRSVGCSQRTVTEGPFAEAKEIVAGYWILQVKSMDEAIEWAKRLPFEAGGEPEAEGEIEIRQLFELEEFG
jgi:hypothetical protein